MASGGAEPDDRYDGYDPGDDESDFEYDEEPNRQERLRAALAEMEAARDRVSRELEIADAQLQHELLQAEYQVAKDCCDWYQGQLVQKKIRRLKRAHGVAFREPRRFWVHPLRTVQYRNTRGLWPSEINEWLAAGDPGAEIYKRYFRMTHDMFEKLHGLVEDRIRKSTSGRGSLDTRLKLYCTILKLTQGLTNFALSVAFKCGESTISKFIGPVCDAIYIEMRRQGVVQWPQTVEEWENIARDFEHKTGFPNCVGCIDGKHFAVHRYNKNPVFFKNYKKYGSQVLMAVVDANYKFMTVSYKHYGSENDAGIFSKMDLGQNILALSERGINVWNFPESAKPAGFGVELPFVFLGDEAFPLKKHMMVPYNKSKLNDPTVTEYVREIRRIFNYRLSSARCYVECAFGILVQRFRLFMAPLESDPDVTNPLLIDAAVAIHNFLIDEKQLEAEEEFFDQHDDDDGHLIRKAIWKTHRSLYVRGFYHLHGHQGHAVGGDIRDSYARYFVTAGERPGQREAAGLPPESESDEDFLDELDDSD